MTTTSSDAIRSDASAGTIPLFRRLTRTDPRLGWTGYAIAIGGTVALTLALLPFRDDLTPLSKGFGYLCVVVAAAAIGGLGPGILASIGGFVTFNYFFIPPYGTFVISRPEFVVILFVFLGLSVIISELLARAAERARMAESREEELRTIQALSHDLTLGVPGKETYEAALRRVCEVFGYSAATLFVEQTDEVRGLVDQVTVGDAEGPLDAHWDPATDERAPERLPLSVGGRMLGLIVLKGDRPPTSPAEARVLRSFCDQLALVLERDRLLRTATDAEIYRQTETSRRALLAAVSHDLRSPLAAIKASATDLLDPEESAGRKEDRHEALVAIDAEADRLNDLIGNLLDISRIEAGMLRAKPETVELAEVLAESVDRARRQRPELKIGVRIADDAELVRADPVFLDRVVTNLVDNAASAADSTEERAVEIQARGGPGIVTIRVVDHGAGVSQVAREQLFTPFYRLNERNPRLGPGLGLAICKGFVSLMRGEIWIEDTPGGGATFAFSLPLPGAGRAA
jgi:two-component system, OmpR family, sensor histidine kinase KdpD